MKTLTSEQLTLLQPYEKHFATAVRGRYCMGVSAHILTKMRDILDELNGTTTRLNFGCSECALNIVRDLGKIYLAQTGKTPDEIAPPVVRYYDRDLNRIDPAKAAEKPAIEAKPAKATAPSKKKPASKTAKKPAPKKVTKK